jgi:hypothetical protein
LLGIAILLGMSERFLLRLEKPAEAAVDPDRMGPDPAAPSSTSAAAQRKRPPGPKAPPATTTPAKTVEQNGEVNQAGSRTP